MEARTNGQPADPGGAEAKAASGAGLALVMDELAYGVVVADLAGRVLHANQAARHELARRRALLTAQGLLQAQAPRDARVLQEALAKAGEGKRSLITLAAVDGRGLTAAVVPLRGPEEPQPRRAALVFARGLVCDPLMLCFFARSHNLTGTEEQVLGILCQGHSAPEVAQQMQLAVSTVRSHIRSLCAKTRSAGVRELVNRVAVLPPLAPALWHEAMH